MARSSCGRSRGSPAVQQLVNSRVGVGCSVARPDEERLERFGDGHSEVVIKSFMIERIDLPRSCGVTCSERPIARPGS